MDKIDWCLKQKTGIEIIEPNMNLKKAHLIKAEESLETLRTTKSKEWQITTSYYTTYQGIYSLLMEIGIKCEIHSCTIEIVKQFLTKYFSKEDIEFIENSFSARIDAQYYTDREISKDKYEKIIKNTPPFLVKCKNIIITEKERREIREKLQ